MSKKALRKLVQLGCSELDLRSILDSSDQLPETWRPSELRKLSVDAKALEKKIDAFFTGTLDGWSFFTDANPAKEALRSLPPRLRDFSSYIDALTTHPGPRRLDIRRDLLWAAVSAYVERKTGAPNDALVAAFVSPTGTEYGGDQLKTFRARHRKLIEYFNIRAADQPTQAPR